MPSEIGILLNVAKTISEIFTWLISWLARIEALNKTEFQNLELADRLGWKLWMEMRPIYISKRGFAACGTATTCSTNWKAGNCLKWFISSALQIVDESATTCSTNWKAGNRLKWFISSALQIVDVEVLRYVRQIEKLGNNPSDIRANSTKTKTYWRKRRP